MNTKAQLVDQVCRLLAEGAGIRIYGPQSRNVTASDRKLAESRTVEFLETALAQLTQEKIRLVAANSPEVQQVNEQRRQDYLKFKQDQEWLKIFATKLPGNLSVLPNEANRQVMLGFRNPDEDIVTLEIFLDAIRHPNLLRQLTLGEYLDPKQRQQAAAVQQEDDRALFSEMARQNDIADTEANFLLVRSLIGSGFDRSRLAHALTMRGLSPATAQDQQQWKEERIEQENAALASDYVSPRQKEQIAQQRFAEEHRATVHSQIEYELVLGYERDVIYGGKASPLPATFNGQPLTSEFIKKCDRDTLKKMIHRYGSSQVTARLRGIKRASAVLDRGNGLGPQVVEYQFE